MRLASDATALQSARAVGNERILFGLLGPTLLACGMQSSANSTAGAHDASTTGSDASSSSSFDAQPPAVFDAATTGPDCVLDLSGGSVTTFIDAVERAWATGAPPGSDAVSLTPPATAQSFATSVAAILAGDPSSACSLTAPYRAAKMTDPQAGPLWLVAELTADGEPAPALYWGTYLATQTPQKRATWLVEAPHPYADFDSEHQAADVFVRIGARALLVAGSHRCADVADGTCTGTTTACGANEAYRVTDAAHSSEVPFLALHDALSSAFGATSFLQLHGNEEQCPTMLLSDGSGSWPDGGVLPALATALSARSIDAGLCGAGFPTTACNLCGTDDIEGRASAGSADACTANGTTYGAMVHIEQQAVSRDPTSAVYPLVLDSIDEAIP